MSYASAVTDGSGLYSLAFVMPGTWPDGEAIESGTLALLVATENFGVQLDYFEHTGNARITLDWYRLGDLTPGPTVTPGAPASLLFSNHPWNNQRGVKGKDHHAPLAALAILYMRTENGLAHLDLSAGLSGAGNECLATEPPGRAR